MSKRYEIYVPAKIKEGEVKQTMHLVDTVRADSMFHAGTKFFGMEAHNSIDEITVRRKKETYDMTRPKKPLKETTSEISESASAVVLQMREAAGAIRGSVVAAKGAK